MCLNFPDFRNTLISEYARSTLETEIFDGECFIGMDLVDINGLTEKLKLRKLLRLAWTEVTGMVTMLAH